MLHGAAFVTLCRGLQLPDDRDPLLQAAGGSPELLSSVLLRLLHCDTDLDDSGTTRFILPPHEPDLIGERLLLRLSQLELEHGDPLGLVARSVGIGPIAWLRNALQVNPAGTMQILLLLAQDFPRVSTTLAWVQDLMRLTRIDDGTDPIADDKQQVILLKPAIYVTLAQAIAPPMDSLWNLLLEFAHRNELRWSSTFVAAITALPRVLNSEIDSQCLEQFTLHLSESMILRNASTQIQLLLSTIGLCVS